MWKQSENIVHRLFSRQINRAPPNTHINKTRQLYENIVPSFTVYDVECPEQLWRCFTNDGQYLICFSRNLHDVLIYRPCWLSYCPAPDSVDELPVKAKKFESYFTLLHQIPLVSGQTELLCKDFFLATENNVYGIFAASTIQDTNPAAATGVFLHDDLLAVLSVRFQCIHILQVRDGGLFLDVRTIGNFCREDDELLLNSQSQVLHSTALV
jgi:de-etiolated-1